MAIGDSMAGLFGKNPVSHLRKHFDTTQECARKLPAFIKHANQGDWQAAEEAQQAIAELEAKADQYKADLRLSLPKRLFTSIPREDLLEIIDRQDKIANTTKDIAGLMLGRKMTMPEAIRPSYDNFLNSSLETIQQAHLAVEELDELMESGFGGRDSKTLQNLIIRLNELEHQNDENQIQVRAELFAVEKELNPIDAIFLYRVIDHTGMLADRAQKLGSQLMQLIAR